jgi:phasin family protein
MSTATPNMTDQLQKMMDLQKEALEPMRAYTTLAAETFERLARQNYAVIGDYINFAVDQARLPARAADPTELFTKQFDAMRAFSEQLTRRSQEYMEIASAVSSKTQATVAATTEKAARKAA